MKVKGRIQGDKPMDKIYLPPYANEDEFEYFVEDLDFYFDRYLGKEVFVRGTNLNWRGQDGEKYFLLEDTKQIFRELVHLDTDFTFSISKARGRNTYKATSTNHDCHSHFILSFRKPEEKYGITRHELAYWDQFEEYRGTS